MVNETSTSVVQRATSSTETLPLGLDDQSIKAIAKGLVTSDSTATHTDSQVNQERTGVTPLNEKFCNEKAQLKTKEMETSENDFAEAAVATQFLQADLRFEITSFVKRF